MNDQEKAIELQNQEYINNQLKKYNLADKEIEELKEKFGHLEIKGIEDKAGYEAVQKAIQEVRPKRTDIDKMRKALNEDAQVYIKSINAEAKRLTELIEPLENDLKAKKDAIDSEKERIKKEDEEKKEKLIQQRLHTLIDQGMSFNGEYYAIGENIKLSVVDVRNMTDETFKTLFDSVVEVADKIKEAQRIKDEEAKAESDRLKAEREDFERKKAEQEKKEQEFAERELNLAKAEENAKQEKIRNRSAKVQNLGLVFDHVKQLFVYKTKDFGGLEYQKEFVLSYTDEQFESVYENAKSLITNLRNKQTEKDVLDAEAEKERIIKEENARLLEEQNKKEEEEKLAIEQMPDVEKVNTYLSNLLKFAIETKPEIKNEFMRSKFENIYNRCIELLEQKKSINL